MKNVFEKDRANGDERPEAGTESCEVVTVVAQQVRPPASSAGDMGSIPDQAAEMLRGAEHCQRRAVKKRALEEEPLRGQTKVFGIWGMIRLESHLFNKDFQHLFCARYNMGIGVQR